LRRAQDLRPQGRRFAGAGWARVNDGGWATADRTGGASAGEQGFVEKPLTHTVQEARTLAWVAAPPRGVLGASCRGASQV